MDEMLATATAHWGPRLTANGVLPGDFTHVISTISTCLIPWTDQARLAEEAGGELLLLDEGNHGCGNLPDHHRPYTADWLADKLDAG